MFIRLGIFALVLSISTLAFARQDAAQPSATSASSTKKKPATKSATAKKGAGTKAKARKTAAKKKASPAKFRRMRRAFVASAELRPMARQLVQYRTPAAYTGVESYARRHAGSDAGVLAWLAVGYARIQDQQYPQAIAALERARPGAGDLADYVRYLEATSYAAEGNNAKTVELLRNFEEQVPESIFLKDVVEVYGTALSGEGKNAEAISYLEAHRTPTRAQLELALGRCYLRSEHPEKGVEILRHLYYTMPASAESDDAAKLLAAQGWTLEGSYNEIKTRADLLNKAGRWSDAAKDYRQLLQSPPPGELGSLSIALAAALRHSNAAESLRLLQQTEATGEANAQRLYLLSEIARNENNEAAVAANVDTLRQQAPSSAWFEQALMLAGNMYMLERNYDRAIDMFRELQQRFPSGQRASYAHWKAAWLSYRQGRHDVARQDFEDQVAWYPDRPEVPAALYWRARIAEEVHDYALARRWYAKLGEHFQNYYYGYLGKERLTTLPAAASGVALRDDALLAQLPKPKEAGPEALQLEPPEDNLRAQKARLLVNAGLNEYAIRELQAEQGGQGARWATLMIARIYEGSGENHRAIQFLKRSLPGYYTLDLPSLPRPYWELLFPRAYWGELSRQAEANSLDPYLVASLIRQESEFNPGAVSHANAYGLMQLLPQVGKGEARAAHLRHFSTEQLLTPAINIQLGAHYFREMVNEYNGQVEYALAAYNAGTNRVADWLQNGHYGDVAEFVESIPFTETREYVQAIVRNARVYERLYPRR
jgi:soluble lytic murein transglycosylase